MGQGKSMLDNSLNEESPLEGVFGFGIPHKIMANGIELAQLFEEAYEDLDVSLMRFSLERLGSERYYGIGMIKEKGELSGRMWYDPCFGRSC
jgi:hypothetical protein